MLILRIVGTDGGSECCRSPYDYGPWGRWGTNQQESVAGLSGHSLLTLFPIYTRSVAAERTRVCDWSALARKEQSRNGAGMIGVRRGAEVPRRTEPKRVSVALAKRTGFDRLSYSLACHNSSIK